MINSPENRVLIQLHAIRRDISDAQESLTEIKRRLTNLKSGQASIIQHLGNLAAIDVQQQLAIDGLSERLVRIERWLELREVYSVCDRR